MKCNKRWLGRDLAFIDALVLLLDEVDPEQVFVGGRGPVDNIVPHVVGEHFVVDADDVEVLVPDPCHLKQIVIFGWSATHFRFTDRVISQIVDFTR